MLRYPCAFLAMLFLCLHTNAQLLTETPAFPKDTSSVTIVVDCTKGNQGLMNYATTSDVYVHIGLITNLSANSGDWRYAPFTWGTTLAAAHATSLGNNKYSYTINNIRSFFAVPAGETILRVAILFRNGTGSQAQRNIDGSDMFIPVYTTALASRFIEPALQPRYTPILEPITKNVGDRIRINYQSNNTATLKLWFNGPQIDVGTGTGLVDSPLITNSGNQQIIGAVTDGVTTLLDTVNFFVAPPAAILPQPGGTRDGINYEPGDTSAILVLYAPGKNRVSVIGDFNNWTEALNTLMNKTPDGLRFWVRITGLTAGTEYAFQYLVDNSIRMADPYTQKVLDPSNDGSISASTYPNLKAYPTGKTTGIVGILQTAEQAYTWQVNNFSRPDKRSLVIYELLLRDFVGNHDWKTLKDTLTYFKNLGINAIEIMPFNEFEGNLSWGYNPNFYLAPDKYYGPKSALKTFVDACHQQGIAVIMDMVLNHSFGTSPMVQLYWDAINNRPAPDNPWFNTVPKHAFNVGYDMNHESLATRYFVSRVVEHWLTEYKLDGFRFDLSKGFTQKATCDANGNNCDVNAFAAYDSSRVAIWKRYYDTIQSKSNGSYVILEHFAVNPEEKDLSDYGMMLWGNMNYNFNQATMGYTTDWNFEQGISTVRGWNNPYLVTYMESHDEERLMYKNIAFGNSTASYSVKDLNTALKRNEMAATFCFMIPGPKMLWQFGETGYDLSINTCQDGSINNNCRTDPKPPHWEYLQNFSRQHLHDVYAGLMKLRSNALYKNDFSSNRVTRSLDGAFKWLVVTTDTSNLVVIGNFDVAQAQGSVTLQPAGTWYDYFSGQTFTSTGSAQSITLQPGEYHLYVNRNITNALTPTTDINSIINNTRLAVYPNPISKSSVIEYEIPVNASINLSLLNIYGQQLGVLYSGFRPKGDYKLPLTGTNKLSKGIYLVELDIANEKKVLKIIID